MNDMHPSLSPVSRIETVLDEGHGRQACEALLGIPITFGAPVTRWSFKPGAFHAPLPMASPLLETTYGELCARIVQEARDGDEVFSRLYALLARAAPHFPNASGACRVLGVSERTLYRKLRANHLTFAQVVDQVREQRATYLLDNTRMSVAAVAEALGFSETASFSRAFRRWKGITPLRFRHRAANMNENSALAP